MLVTFDLFVTMSIAAGLLGAENVTAHAFVLGQCFGEERASAPPRDRRTRDIGTPRMHAAPLHTSTAAKSFLAGICKWGPRRAIKWHVKVVCVQVCAHRVYVRPGSAVTEAAVAVAV